MTPPVAGNPLGIGPISSRIEIPRATVRGRQAARPTQVDDIDDAWEAAAENSGGRLRLCNARPQKENLDRWGRRPTAATSWTRLPQWFELGPADRRNIRVVYLFEGAPHDQEVDGVEAAGLMRDRLLAHPELVEEMGALFLFVPVADRSGYVRNAVVRSAARSTADVILDTSRSDFRTNAASSYPLDLQLPGKTPLRRRLRPSTTRYLLMLYKPDLVIPWHAAQFLAGTEVYVEKVDEEYCRSFDDALRSVGGRPYTGPSEYSFREQSHPGVRKAVSIRELYEAVAAAGGDLGAQEPFQGGMITDWMREHLPGSQLVLTEVAMNLATVIPPLEHHETRAESVERCRRRWQRALLNSGLTSDDRDLQQLSNVDAPTVRRRLQYLLNPESQVDLSDPYMSARATPVSASWDYYALMFYTGVGLASAQRIPISATTQRLRAAERVAAKLEMATREVGAVIDRDCRVVHREPSDVAMEMFAIGMAEAVRLSERAIELDVRRDALPDPNTGERMLDPYLIDVDGGSVPAPPALAGGMGV